MDNLYFITGMPRSGTTIISSGLNKISRVVVPKETHYFEYLGTSFRKQLFPSNRLGLANRILLDNGIREIDDLDSAPVDAIGLYFDLVGKIKKHFDAEFLIEKTPNHYKYIGEINFRNVNIKVVHLIRDPRDVYLSRQKVPWGKRSAYAIADEFRRSIAIIEDLKKQDVECMVVKYEDLIVDPRRYFKEICAFFEIEFTESILEPGQTTDYDIKFEYWKSKNRETIDSKNAYKWKRFSSESWQKIIVHISSAELRLFGYEYTYSSVAWWQLCWEWLSFYKERATGLCRKLVRCFD